MIKYFLCFTSLLSSITVAQRAITVEDLWAMKRIGVVVVSPDGELLVFSQTEYSMDTNKGKTDIWCMSRYGDQLKKMTRHSGNHSNPQWKPDGSGITFLASRDGLRQVYFMPIDGGEAYPLTKSPVDIESYIWAPKGKYIAFTAQIYPDAESIHKSVEIDKKKKESQVQAKLFDHLLFRSWNRWTDNKRTHVFTYDLQTGEISDLTVGDYDSPPLSLGGHQDYSFSPDGTELAFVSNRTPFPAANTNNDVFIISLDSRETINLTETNEAVDNQPVYSPDGRYLVYRAMSRPVFEADQYNIILYNRISGERINLTDDLNLSPDEVIWCNDSQRIFFSTRERGRKTIYQMDIEKRVPVKLIVENVNSNLQISPDDNILYFKKQSAVSPYEIVAYSLADESLDQLTFVNRDLLAQLDMNPVEDFSYPSFDGKTVHGFIIKPPAFDVGEKYPLLLLVHGGPQGMWSDDFHYRWNLSLFASPGYVVVALNIRGSKGYGQEWCDAVSKNWGGGPYQDLMAGVDAVIETFGFIDDTKLAAAGASYGGFMINWIATHTDRFDALVSHAGVFDQRSMYGATEELWFPEWEFDGTPYENPHLYEKWSPSTYAENLKEYKTPTLVIHGQGDFRVPVTQGFQTFTALQRMGVPSRLLYFPDETHFVTKPQNAKLWWSEVFSWIEKWINQ